MLLQAEFSLALGNPERCGLVGVEGRLLSGWLHSRSREIKGCKGTAMSTRTVTEMVHGRLWNRCTMYSYDSQN